MSTLSITTSPDERRLIVSGDIRPIVESRRAMRLLNDAFEVFSTSPTIVVGASDNFSHSVDLLRKVASIARCECQLVGGAASSMERYKADEARFAEFSSHALNIRENNCNRDEFATFKESLERCMTNRRLYPLQMLAAYHLAFSQNACNFSVPGAGKTSVVYGAYAYLHSLPSDDPKHIDRILIISPLNAFGPWETEFAECFGRKPETKRLAGVMPMEAKKQYLYGFDPAEVTLLSYASVITLADELAQFLRSSKVMVVLDEAHKIKNTAGGVISESILRLAPLASSRVVLTGTPAPNGYEDIYNLFRFVWPNKSIVRFNVGQLKDMSRIPNDVRVKSLLDSINPFFLRIKKSDLHIPPATEHEPILVDMSPAQRRLYDYIEQRYVGELSDRIGQAFFSEMAQARMIRLMQAATNPGLLTQPIRQILIRDGIDPEHVTDDSKVLSEVLRFANDEMPVKFEVMANLVEGIVSRGEKVVVWANFIANIDRVHAHLQNKGIDSRVLYGGTPVAGDAIDEEDPAYALTREAIVREFNQDDCPYKVIVANPFAVAESISLHKACHNAIYLERSFNAAHFLQSKDRIHRYGLREGTQTNYYYILARNSIDETIHQRLIAKERRLLKIIESMPIPLFSNVLDDGGDEDIKALLRDYACRTQKV